MHGTMKSVPSLRRKRHQNDTRSTSISRAMKFVSVLSIMLLRVDLGTSFSLPPLTRSAPTTVAVTPPLDINIGTNRNVVGSFSHQRSLLSKMANSDTTETTEDGSKIQNWFFGLVVPLQLVYVSNQLTRSSIYYMVDFSTDPVTGAAAADPFRAMNVAIGFSEAQYGLLASLAFTALFAIASLGAGAAADKYDRKALTVGSSVGWSVAILGTALSTTYTEVLSWRIIMGLFCAFSTPTAYTLISDKVPKDRLSLATSIYGTGVAFGGALASLAILLDNRIGWSQTLLAIGGLGLVCAVLAALLVPSDDSKSPSAAESVTTIDVTNRDQNGNENENENENEPSYSFAEGVSEALSTTRAKWIYGGSFLRFCSGLCIGVWSAPFFREAFPDNASDYAVAQAFITAVASSISGLAGGAGADYLSSSLSNNNNDDDNDDDNGNGNDNGNEKDVTGIRLWIPVVGSLLAAPTWYLAIHSTDSFQTAMVWLTLEYLVAECWFGPTISTLLSTVPSKVGGTAQGMFTLTGAIANLSPTFLGYLYGQASSTAASVDGIEASSSASASASELLPALLTTAVCFGYVSSAFCFAMGARSQPPVAAIKSKST